MWGEKYLVIAYIVFMTVGAVLCLAFFAYVIFVTLREAAEAEEAEAAAASATAAELTQVPSVATGPEPIPGSDRPGSGAT